MQATLEITRYLLDARQGDKNAFDKVFEHVYASLRAIAHKQLNRHRYGDTLNTTALVHEAYARLIGSSQIDIKDRAHFFSIAARAMRFILVDYARNRSAGKRGGWQSDLQVDALEISVEEKSDELLCLDEALTRLMGYDEKLGRLVELRFFGGLTYDEIAAMQGRSPRTVKREWQRARAWIYYAMTDDDIV